MKKESLLGLLMVIGMHPTFGQGFEANPNGYNKMPQVAQFEPVLRLAEGNLKHSLRQYCPPPTHQGNVPSCVFQSLCYGVMSIMYNIESERTNPTDATAFSALYGYIQVSRCDITQFNIALDFLQANGTPFLHDFEKKDRANCKIRIEPEHHLKASAHKIKGALSLFDANTHPMDRLNKLRRCISEDKPVAVGMFLPNRSFEGCHTEYYIGEKHYLDTIKHAMVVVGYDEYSVELMNSYGTNWGKDGFVKLSHADFLKYCQEAYQLIFEPMDVRRRLAGRFEFRTPLEGKMQPIDFKLQEGRYYETVCTLGQQFQLAATELQANKYVYVFSKDSEGNVLLHWPRNRKNKYGAFELLESPLTPYEGSELLIPGPKRALIKDKLGKDYLFVLYSSAELSLQLLSEKLQAMERNTDKNVLNSFEKTFQDWRVAWEDLQLESSKPAFQSAVRDRVVPLVLIVEGR